MRPRESGAFFGKITKNTGTENTGTEELLPESGNHPTWTDQLTGSVKV